MTELNDTRKDEQTSTEERFIKFLKTTTGALIFPDATKEAIIPHTSRKPEIITLPIIRQSLKNPADVKFNYLELETNYHDMGAGYLLYKVTQFAAWKPNEEKIQLFGAFRKIGGAIPFVSTADPRFRSWLMAVGYLQKKCNDIFKTPGQDLTEEILSKAHELKTLDFLEWPIYGKLND
jgi:hypothetical protein